MAEQMTWAVFDEPYPHIREIDAAREDQRGSCVLARDFMPQATLEGIIAAVNSCDRLRASHAEMLAALTALLARHNAANKQRARAALIKAQSTGA